MIEIPALMFLAVCLVLLAGFPVALTLAGVGLLFAAIGTIMGTFDASYLAAIPARIFGTIGNETLIAVPLFILMGNILERAKIAEDLLNNMAQLLGSRPGGLGIAVVIVGALLAASTGIVGATVVTMGAAITAFYAARRIQPGPRSRYDLCHRHTGSNHTAIDRFGFIG